MRIWLSANTADSPYGSSWSPGNTNPSNTIRCASASTAFAGHPTTVSTDFSCGGISIPRSRSRFFPSYYVIRSWLRRTLLAHWSRSVRSRSRSAPSIEATYTSVGTDTGGTRAVDISQPPPSAYVQDAASTSSLPNGPSPPTRRTCTPHHQSAGNPSRPSSQSHAAPKPQPNPPTSPAPDAPAP